MKDLLFREILRSASPVQNDTLLCVILNEVKDLAKLFAALRPLKMTHKPLLLIVINISFYCVILNVVKDPARFFAVLRLFRMTHTNHYCTSP